MMDHGAFVRQLPPSTPAAREAAAPVPHVTFNLRYERGETV
jgi:hypothetical protein